MRMIAGAIFINAAATFMVAGEDGQAVFAGIFGVGVVLWSMVRDLSEIGDRPRPQRDQGGK